MPVAAASRVLEAVAGARGLAVQRLSPELVAVDHEEQRVLFHGLAGPSVSRVAQLLCENEAWLRPHLVRHGLPVGEPSAAGSAYEVAVVPGFPVVDLQAASPEPEIAALAERVLAALPGTAYAAVRIRAGQAPVVEAATPFLPAWPGWADLAVTAVAEQILTFELEPASGPTRADERQRA